MRDRLPRCASTILSYVEPWARTYVAPAVWGNADAALDLCYAAGNSTRARIAMDMWRARVDRAAFRPLLGAVWDHDHRVLIRATETRRRLQSLFQYAAFPIPDHLPDSLTVWRGTSYLTVLECRRGLSWTLDRDIACWFAMRFAERNGRPLVLRATVPRSAVALYTHERHEDEVVIFGRLDAYVDGTPEDWAVRYAMQQRRNKDADANLPAQGSAAAG